MYSCKLTASHVSYLLLEMKLKNPLTLAYQVECLPYPDVFLCWNVMNDWIGLREAKEALVTFRVFLCLPGKCENKQHELSSFSRWWNPTKKLFLAFWNLPSKTISRTGQDNSRRFVKILYLVFQLEKLTF